MLLTADDHRIEDPACVVDRHVANHVDLARLSIDLDHRNVGTERVGRVRTIEVELVLKARLHVGWPLAVVDRCGVDLGPADGLCGYARDPEATIGFNDVFGGSLEQVCRELLAHGEHVFGSDEHG